LKKSLSILLLYLIVTPIVVAQSSVESISGRLISSQDHSPIGYADILMVETEQWTTTNEDGYFTFNKVAVQTFTLEIQCLGKQRYSQSYNTKDYSNKSIEIQLLSESYDMEEVTVTAEKGKGMTTTSTIDNTAIQHVQPTTLGDVMQLLAGNLIENPDLSEKQTIAMREVGTDANSAAGTAIILDGAPMSSDADFQTLSTTRMTTTGSSVQNDDLGTSNSTGTGLDMRQISTDNIESISVIKGIPSVEYGNLTSGAVVVKTKSGYTPLEVRLKTAPLLKQAYVGKGVKLSNGGALNANIEYTNSYKDLRSKYTGYDRISGQLGYSKTFAVNNSPLSFNSKLSVHNTLNQEKTDPDALVAEETLRTSETSARVNMYGKWALNNRFITNLNYNFSSTLKAQEDYQKKYRSAGTYSITTTLEEGENEGLYIGTANSLTEVTIKGLPLDVFAQVSANKNISSDQGIVNNILAGAEYRLSGNYGEGSIYDIYNPPTISNNATRPRSFKDIPSAETFSLFLENKLTLPIKATVLDVQAGLRVNNFQPTSLTSGDIGIYYEPRLNVRYKFIDNKDKLIKKLSLHGGIGLNYKAPSLVYLYPDRAYIDLVSLSYYTEDPATQLVYYTSKNYDSTNPNLKPAKNLKRELGLDFNIGSVIGDITIFKEKLSDGFGFTEEYKFIDYKAYDASATAAGVKPDISTLPFTEAVYIESYNRPVNNKASEKLGIEYTFNFGKIKALATQVTMNGAWMKTTRNYSTTTYDYLPTKSSAGQYSEIGVYPSGEGSVAERLNTTFRFVTHSSRLRLVFTTTMQITWMDKFSLLYYDETPILLYNQSGDVIPFTDEMRNDIAYKDYVLTKGDNTFLTESMPPLLLCNFKLSKELTDLVKLSFYANNFLNHRPLYYSERTLSSSRRNQAIYFGAEISLTL